MKLPVMKSQVAVALLVVLAALGTGGWFLYRSLTRPSLAKLGGTILVYEVDLDGYPDGKLPPGYNAEEMVTALQRRLDPTERNGIVVTSAGPLRNENCRSAHERSR